MSKRFAKTTLLAVTAFVAATAAGFAADVPPYIKSAVMDSGRPDADTARDEHRHPAELVTFAGVKPGDKVGEIMPGGGYYTRILSKVVGSTGKVYAYTLGFRPIPQITGDKEYSNVTEESMKLDEFSAPEPLDVVWTTENFHDFHNPRMNIDMKAVDKKVFDALKPGGVFLITDHAAPAGTGVQDVGTLHRIDPAYVKQEVESVGFKLEAQSDLLANPKDDHTQASHSMHDMTDRFVFKFVKPKS
jgi:predicted methyltransferase